jgi:hypothetical protein
LLVAVGDEMGWHHYHQHGVWMNQMQCEG